MSKQHNQSNAIFLWTVRRPRMFRTVVDDMCRALVNLRLRRQHEIEVGKDWIERAKEADVGGEEENDNALDRINYGRFCQGLERLDNACLQLDETLMVLKDF
uniref:DNA-directed RNA polymerase III subunit RPC3 n=2 Tax=Odontella aurita TaxID=265563 RepID=A0A6U6JAT0_9STRA|mmetsp:Transcript_5357/g.15633  ORF Transcript_5357/g.15633 Transcript_5357/m.15633 type:complete len:102 (+) Transcript_5357:238-543(+)